MRTVRYFDVDGETVQFESVPDAFGLRMWQAVVGASTVQLRSAERFGHFHVSVNDGPCVASKRKLSLAAEAGVRAARRTT